MTQNSKLAYSLTQRKTHAVKKTIKWSCFAIFALLIVGLIWDGLVGYAPSKDGRWEEKLALEDMESHCDILKIDCSNLRIVRRTPPVQGQTCRLTEGERRTCEETKGSWSFVAKLKTGQEYEIVVVPDDVVMVGPYSQIYQLGLIE